MFFGNHIFRNIDNHNYNRPALSAGQKENAMRNMTITLCFVALVATVAVTSTAYDGTLPGAAHNNGLEGTVWVTDIRVFNPNGLVHSVSIAFTPYGGSEAIDSTFPVEPGHELVLDDVVMDVFGAEASGYISINAEVPLIVGQRTYNLTADGTYGQYIAQQVPSSGLVYFTGLRGGEYRTNLGVVNTSAGSLALNSTIPGFSPDTLNPFVGRQWGRLENGAGFDPAGESGSLSGTMPFAAYVSIVDNTSGDPTYFPGLPLMTEGVLVGLAHNPGAAGTLWRSDVSIFAPTGAEVECNLVPYGESIGESTSVTLSVGETLILSDIVGQSSLGNVSASLWFASNNPILVVGRTYNQTDNGTYGQSILPVTPENFVQPDEEAYFLFASKSITDDTGYRVNLGLANPGESNLVVTVELVNEDGTSYGERTINVLAGSAIQANRVVNMWGLPYLENGVIKATAPGTFTGYLALVDNRTGDGSTVTPGIYSPEAENHPPVIDTFTVPASALVGEDVVVSASASDLDNDELSFHLVWSDGTVVDQTGGTDFTAGRTFGAAGTYTATLTVTDGEANVQASGGVVVSSPELPTLTMSVADTQVCPGTMTTLTWSALNADTFMINNVTKPLTGSMQVGPGTYHGVATNAYGSDEVSVTIGTANCDLPTIDMWADEAQVCPNTTTTLRWTTSNTDSFMVNGEPEDLSGSISIYAGTYTGVATNNFGSVDDSVTVTEYTQTGGLTATVNGPSTGIVDDNLTHTVSTTGGYGENTIDWLVKRGTTTVAVGNGTSINWTPSVSGTYTVRVTVNDRCSGSALDSMTVEVSEACTPPAITGADVNPKNIETNQSSTVTYSSTGDVDGVEVDWGDGNVTSGLTHSFMVAGVYSVRLRLHGCGTWTGWVNAGTVTVSDPCEALVVDDAGVLPLTNNTGVVRIWWHGDAPATFLIEWGDGESTEVNTSNTDYTSEVHTYAPGMYTVYLTGGNCAGTTYPRNAIGSFSSS